MADETNKSISIQRSHIGGSQSPTNPVHETSKRESFIEGKFIAEGGEVNIVENASKSKRTDIQEQPSLNVSLVRLLEEVHQLRDNQSRIVSLLDKKFNIGPEYKDVERISRAFSRKCVQRLEVEQAEIEFREEISPDENKLKYCLGTFKLWLLAPSTDQFAWRYDIWISKKNTGSRKLGPLELRGRAGTKLFESINELWPTAQGFLDAREAGRGRREERRGCCVPELNNTKLFSYHSTNTHSREKWHPRLVSREWLSREKQPWQPMAELTRSAYGILCDIGIGMAPGVLEFDAAATMLFFVTSTQLKDNRYFLDGHLSEWNERPSLNHLCGNVTREVSFVFMHHMRSFVDTSPTNHSHSFHSEETPPSGIFCKRENLVANSPDGTTLKLSERRYSLGLNMLPVVSSYGTYALVSVVDDLPRSQGIWRDSPRVSENRWGHFDLLPAESHTGIVAFQFQLCSFILSWEKDWTTTLDALDKTFLVKLGDLSDCDSRKKLMFDSRNLSRSDLYFQLSQILRIFSDSITESLSQLEDLAEVCTSFHGNVELLGRFRGFVKRNPSYLDEVQQILNFNWGKVLSLHKSATKKLLRRVDRKTGEIKSLSDALPKAQLVRDVTQTSQYFIVITIVAILFFPPMFVAVLYAMHLFEQTGGGRTQTKFWTVFIAVSGSMYFFTVALLVRVSQAAKGVRERVWKWFYRAKSLTEAVVEKRPPLSLFQRRRSRQQDERKDRQSEVVPLPSWV